MMRSFNPAPLEHLLGADRPEPWPLRVVVIVVVAAVFLLLVLRRWLRR